MSNTFLYDAAHAWWVCAWFAGLASIGCDVSQPVSADPECIGGRNCIDASASVEDEVPVNEDAASSVPTLTPDAALVLSCPGLCLPDDPGACLAPELLSQRSSEDGSTSVEDSVVGADAAFSGDDSEALDASSVPYQDGSAIEAGSASVGDAASALDGAADSGLTDAAGRALDVLDAAKAGGGGSGSSALSCQLAWDQNQLVSGCAVAGTGNEGSACASARDCRPGFGCVGAAGAGQCLPYCCEGQKRCGEGRYCTERPMRAPHLELGASAPLIPVCAVADQCSLMLGPCTDDEPCSCSEDRACTVVDRAGTTACVQPGPGKEGDACPCAAGYFCSQGTKTCLKFCNTQDPTSACGERWCQPGPSGFPMGWGLCVDHVD